MSKYVTFMSYRNAKGERYLWFNNGKRTFEMLNGLEFETPAEKPNLDFGEFFYNLEVHFRDDIDGLRFEYDYHSNEHGIVMVQILTDGGSQVHDYRKSKLRIGKLLKQIRLYLK